MKAAVVMELKNGRAILLLRDGRFLNKSARPNWMVGDTVLVEDNTFNRKKTLALAAVIALFLIISVQASSLYLKKVTFISIDVNPSIEIGVNRFNRVVAAKGWNPEGEQLLQDLSLKNKSYQEALGILIQSDKFQTYLTNSNYLMLSVYTKNQSANETFLTGVKNAASLHLPDNHAIEIDCRSISESTLRQAHSHHMSAGKYSAILELIQNDGSATSVEEYAHYGIDEIKDHMEDCQGNHPGEIHEHEDGHNCQEH